MNLSFFQVWLIITCLLGAGLLALLYWFFKTGQHKDQKRASRLPLEGPDEHVED